jgi:hypothetical protein
MEKPHLIRFFSNGNDETGFVSVAEYNEQIPFEIQRLYWIYGFGEETVRGNHAYKSGKQVLICMAGEVMLTVESPSGEIYEFKLTSPSEGVYIPGTYWRKVKVNKGNVILCISSHRYDPENYVRNYSEFRGGIA